LGVVVVGVVVVVLRGVVVVVGVVVRLGDVIVGLVVVGFVVVLGLAGPNEPPPAVPLVESCCAKAEERERQTIAIVPINRSEGRHVGITFLLIKKD